MITQSPEATWGQGELRNWPKCVLSHDLTVIKRNFFYVKMCINSLHRPKIIFKIEQKHFNSSHELLIVDFQMRCVTEEEGCWGLLACFPSTPPLSSLENCFAHAHTCSLTSCAFLKSCCCNGFLLIFLIFIHKFDVLNTLLPPVASLFCQRAPSRLTVSVLSSAAGNLPHLWSHLHCDVSQLGPFNHLQPVKQKHKAVWQACRELSGKTFWWIEVWCCVNGSSPHGGMTHTETLHIDSREQPTCLSFILLSNKIAPKRDSISF